MNKFLPGLPIFRRLLLLGILLGVLLPLLPLFVWAFSHRWLFPDILPESLSLRSWTYLVHSGSRILRALGNSLVIALAVTALSILVGVPAGRALGLYKFRGKLPAELILLSPALIPSLTVTMGIQILFIRYGLTETIFGVVLVHLIPTIPYMTISMSGVFSHYDIAFEEQARSLGAGRIRIFTHITLPAVLPGIIVGSMFSFLISWGQYILTLMIGGGRIITLPLLLFSFASSGDNALTAALGLLFLMPSVAILIFSSRYLTGKSSGIGGLGGL
ncbi:ABC transporter permease [Oceanispirochaeta sp.]|jgi:putative spermidine/putrescine transport system permease protein|uniref:ABC transporter permease n=1 Tax=Oceanispirochaeta sp. TaxID=2035350 RepID=UPI0026164C7B|nr:ABC transporter permease subunit [Oceanispirochaeta sp.]MDA3955470.1 ABC transporter permease subunit [Oceanispirochaeta sp.]